MGIPAGTTSYLICTVAASKIAGAMANFPHQVDLSSALASDLTFKSAMTTAANIAVYDVTSDVVRPRIVMLDLTNNKLLISFDAPTSTSADRVYYICVGSGISQSDSATAFSNSGFVARWGLNNFANDATTPDTVNGYTGTKTSPATLGVVGKLGNCAQMTGGNGGFNCGDVTQLNNVTTFSLETLINTTSVTTQGFLYRKFLDSTHLIDSYIATNGRLYVRIFNGSSANGYVGAGVITIGNWFHIMVVGNLGQPTDATRLKVFVNGNQQTLTFTGTIPSNTGNLTTSPFMIGDTSTSSSFLGKEDEMGIISSAVSTTFITTRYNMFFDSGFWTIKSTGGVFIPSLSFAYANHF